MMTRKEKLKIIASDVDECTSTYSAFMRKLNKENPNLMKDFMRSFKDAFDAAMNERLENHQGVALLKAKQEIANNASKI